MKECIEQPQFGMRGHNRGELENGVSLRRQARDTGKHCGPYRLWYTHFIARKHLGHKEGIPPCHVVEVMLRLSMLCVTGQGSHGVTREGRQVKAPCGPAREIA